MPQPTAPAPGVVARSLHTRFGTLDALGGVDLDVPRGNIVALLGVNGAGKSTLLRILGTTLAADTGTASVAGCDVVTDPLGARRSVGFFLGDERSWYWRLTERHNLEFFAALYGLDKAGARERSDRRRTTSTRPRRWPTPWSCCLRAASSAERTGRSTRPPCSRR